MQAYLFGAADSLVLRRLRNSLRQLGLQPVEIPDLATETVIVPLGQEEIILCRDLLRTHPKWRALIPSVSILEDWSDKARFATFAMTRGLSRHIPQTYGKGVKYPCVFKLTQSSSGRGIHVLHSPEDLERTLTWYGEKPYLLQEYIAGPVDYVAHCLCYRGYIHHLVAYQYHHEGEFQVNRSDSESRCTAYQPSQREIEVIQTFMERGRFTGPCCVDYRIRQGEPVILEINPRLGRSLCFRGHASDLESQLSTLLKCLWPSPPGTPAPLPESEAGPDKAPGA